MSIKCLVSIKCPALIKSDVDQVRSWGIVVDKTSVREICVGDFSETPSNGHDENYLHSETET